MRHTDFEHHCDIGRCNGGQMRNLANMIRTHFGYEIARMLANRQGGKRQPDLVVERSDRGHGRPQRGEQGLGQILGGGFAYRSGDADDGERLAAGATARNIGFGQIAQCRDGVVHHDLRHCGARNLMVHNRGDRALVRNRRHVVMAVDALPLNRHEYAAVLDLPRIAHGMQCNSPLGHAVGTFHQSACNGLGHLADGHRHHHACHFQILVFPCSRLYRLIIRS